MVFYLEPAKPFFKTDVPPSPSHLNKFPPQTLGALIALFERAVGLYASLVGINAYHQPGVEAGKQAAGDVIELALKIQHHLRSHPEQKFTATELSDILQKQTYRNNFPATDNFPLPNASTING
jgi:glucose-6-phosphate isomerase (EC 5.3.1.9)